VLAHFLDNYPKAKITIACGAPAASLFEAVPGLEKLIVLQRQPFLGHWRKLWKQCIGRKWDVIVDLRGSITSYLLRTKKRYIWHSQWDPQHRIVQLSRMLGLKTPSAPRLWFSPKQQADAAVLVPEGAPVLALAPAANWVGKEWPVDRFAEMTQRFLKKHKDARVAVLATAKQRQQVTPLLEAIPKSQRLDLVGKSDLATAAACLKRCHVFVGNDSGLMHMSSALGLTTIGLFGPSNEIWVAPWGPKNRVVRIPQSFQELSAIPGYDPASPDCYMLGLTVDTVYDVLMDVWARENSDNEHGKLPPPKRRQRRQ
jgi:ADP-heptose:LPS heptosyltransferase